MSLIGFNHYNLRADANTLEALKVFYCEVLGMQQGARPALRSFGYWLYIGDKDILHLSLARPDEMRHKHISSTFDHIAFTCSNQSEMEQRLRKHGVEYQSKRVEATGVRQVFFSDPAGNGVELNFSD